MNIDDSLSYNFPNGELVTEAKIHKLLDAHQYYFDTRFPSAIDQKYVITITENNTWKLSDETIIKLYENPDGTFNKMVKVNSDKSETQLNMNFNIQN